MDEDASSYPEPTPALGSSPQPPARRRPSISRYDLKGSLCQDPAPRWRPQPGPGLRWAHCGAPGPRARPPLPARPEVTCALPPAPRDPAWSRGLGWSSPRSPVEVAPPRPARPRPSLRPPPGIGNSGVWGTEGASSPPAPPGGAPHIAPGKDPRIALRPSPPPPLSAPRASCEPPQSDPPVRKTRLLTFAGRAPGVRSGEGRRGAFKRRGRRSRPRRGQRSDSPPAATRLLLRRLPRPRSTAMDGAGDQESMGQPEEANLEEACTEGEQPGEEEQEELETAAYLAELPEALLLRVLAELPAAELMQACRLVCLRWKELVDGAPLWLLKCQQEGLVPEGGGEEEERDHWQKFYFLSKRRRNLLRNPCGEEDLEGWCDVEHGGDGWRVEELPGDSGVEFPQDDSVKKYFASSFEWCRKAQVIDLQAEGYWEELLDTTQPAIVVKDWYSGRSDAGCLYELSVKLLSEHEDVLAEFNTGQVAVSPDSEEGGWIQICHTFTDYGPGVRFVRFEHGGQDSVYWKGWFGARVTSSGVWVEP